MWMLQPQSLTSTTHWKATEQRNAEARSFLWHPPQSHCSLVRSELSETSVDIRISMDICDLTFKPSKQSIISIINYSDIFRLFKAAALHPRLFLLLQELLLKAFLNALKLQTRLLTFLSTAWPTGVLTTWKWLEKVVVTFGLAKAEVLEKSSVCLLEYYEHFMNILEYNRIQKQNSIPSGQSSIRFITRLASAMASLPPDWIAPGAQAFLKCSWHPNLQRKVSRIPVV